MRLIASPASALCDEPVSIRLAEFPAVTNVVVRASTDDDLGRHWSSHAEFFTGANGAVDLTLQAPVAGSYRVADAMGLLWSMTLDSTITERGPFIKTNCEPVTVKLDADVD